MITLPKADLTTFPAGWRICGDAMGTHLDLGHDKRGYTLLTVTAPYARKLPQEFVNACHQWADENDHGLKFVDAASGRRVILRAR